MTADRTTKILLALILLALCALILRQPATTAAAQSAMLPTPTAPAISVSTVGGDTIYVISGGSLSEWKPASEMDDGTPDGKGGKTYRTRDVLKLVDSKPLPPTK